MRKKDCDLMRNIKKFTEEFFVANKRQPSLREISEGLQIGKTTVYRYLHAMDENGMIAYNGTDGVTTELIQRIRTAAATVAERSPAAFPNTRRRTSKPIWSCRGSLWAKAPSIFCGQAAIR